MCPASVVMSTRSAGAAGGAERVRRGHKERSKNFTELEKKTVLELIAMNKDILRQGRSNNATNRSKQQVWSSICEEVNKRCGGGERPRTPAQVKMWYENYKKKCKMRAHDTQQSLGKIETWSDNGLWPPLNSQDIKDEYGKTAVGSDLNHSNAEDIAPVDMSNDRALSGDSDKELDENFPNILEPQISIIPTNSPTPPRGTIPYYLNDQNSQEATDKPLNLSHLNTQKCDQSETCIQNGQSERYEKHVTDEEKLYFSTKRQHAIWEHEAQMRILNLELRQKEELFTLQKQLLLLDLKIKMNFFRPGSP